MLYSPTTAVLTCTVLLTAYLFACRLRDYARLRHVPGPYWAAWTDFWLIRNQLSGRLNFTLQDLNKQHGFVVRIAPNWVVCGDGAELRRMWAVRSPWKRGHWYRGLRIDPYRDSTISTINDKTHEALRSKLAAGYSGKDVDGVHELINEQVAGLVNLLETKYLSTDTTFKTVDLARKVQFFTLDVISALAFGNKLGYLDSDNDTFRYIETTERTVPAMLAAALMPSLIEIIQSPRLKWLMPDTKNMTGIGHVMKMARDVVQERYGDKPVVKRDMLGSFIAHGLSKEDAEGETLVQIIAGSDTSATAIRSTMLFLITNPHVYARLQAEIDTAIKLGRISSPITDEEARKFDYLQAVIREGLRLWPPATGLLPKVSEQDEVVCGVHIPAGTNVAWAPWTVMRSKETFGEDADLFRPERWLGISEEKYRAMDQQVMMDFASGSRWECLGKNIAMIELNKVYVELLRRFDITLLDPSNPWKSFNAAFFIQSEMHVKVTRRFSTA
ncbi:cytochrome P450 86A1 [Colletotrichum higginsianum]|uniref:Cytochrome P450 86A1 n=2 Tax=Colletotrichum higginsianum TaxID=80884 RepID=H1V501_COLHI|nr:Cytochrome P450 86A1 [Colletotrichum higginsianum IMI 349063]OBR03174.1 Cytochrome P450 86A1 [Colletotrichum higginsianum IMI 349063]TIC89845.1 Cytochrome P450 momooxygenase gsfF [Colletotrichum higginsianum]CCF35303.1 cytochrome P450 86A1 [Colletotrichum higginsianum]